jgi:predicted SAM-dependent methyltransferase
LNLGSGRKRLDGWVNVDLNPFADQEIWLDIRDRWPVPAEGADAVYIRHCLEHFTEAEALRILRQSRKVLAPGRPIRIGVPSLEVALQKYRENDFEFMPWVLQHRSPGRRFYRYMMDNDNHRVMFDYGYLQELLELAGFSDITRSAGGRSVTIEPALLDPRDCEEDVATLYVEARKP